MGFLKMQIMDISKIHVEVDIVKIPRIGFHTQGEYHTVKFSHYGTSANDSDGFYGFKRVITRDKMYWQGELTFWRV